ncbi:rRNA maturation RNase YbeY [bacterium]|nr:rRNA maturation RNase YbeY [bacterium]
MSLSKPVCYIFLGDEELLSINIQALDHNYYTDIITFDYSDDDDYSHSEIYISVDRVRENAKEFKTEFKTELLRVCVHGLLHLGGYADKTDEESKKMRAAEEHYLDLQRST